MDIYVDGSCSNNGNFPNKGGFGVVFVKEDGNISTYKKHCENTTNNREELKAILAVFFMHGVKSPLPPPNVYSDSTYSINTLTNWMFNWANNDWKKSDKKVPENLDLIKAYYDYYQKGYRINLQKVKGHSGNVYNELADKLAKGEKV